LSGTAALPLPSGGGALTVSQGATLELNNIGTNLTDRLPDAMPITLTGGTLRVVGSGSISLANTTETVGPITMTGNWSDNIQADGAVVTLMGLVHNSNSTMNFL